jgi:pilus assembly protein Flp/PilA
MFSFFRRWARDKGSVSVVECMLIVSLIAVAALASMHSVGGKVSHILVNVGSP